MPAPTITALPTPPSTSDPTNFATQADAFIAALPTFVTQANALAAYYAATGLSNAATLEGGTWESPGPVGSVARNTIAGTSGSFTGQVAYTKSGAGGGSGAAINITAAACGIGFVDTAGGTNGKNWDILVTGGSFNLRTLTDADTTPRIALSVTRTSASLAITGIQIGNAADATAITIPGHVAGTPTFTAGSKYLVVDASGHIQVSATGPAS